MDQEDSDFEMDLRYVDFSQDIDAPVGVVLQQVSEAAVPVSIPLSGPVQETSCGGEKNGQQPEETLLEAGISTVFAKGAQAHCSPGSSIVSVQEGNDGSKQPEVRSAVAPVDGSSRQKDEGLEQSEAQATATSPDEPLRQKNTRWRRGKRRRRLQNRARAVYEAQARLIDVLYLISNPRHH